MAANLYQGSHWFEPLRHRQALEELLSHPEYGGIWILRANGETAGYLMVTLGYTAELGGRFALLDELFVQEAWRGRSLGTRAIAFVDEWCRARGISAVRLEVAYDNPRALELYRRSGFHTHERHCMSKLL